MKQKALVMQQQPALAPHSRAARNPRPDKHEAGNPRPDKGAAADPYLLPG